MVMMLGSDVGDKMSMVMNFPRLLIILSNTCDCAEALDDTCGVDLLGTQLDMDFLPP